jgi:hypothetical protein
MPECGEDFCWQCGDCLECHPHVQCAECGGCWCHCFDEEEE